MKIYKISSTWSTEFVLAPSVEKAIQKYKENLSDIENKQMTEIKKIKFIGDALL